MEDFKMRMLWVPRDIFLYRIPCFLLKGPGLKEVSKKGSPGTGGELK
jgi:hypothetical protein